MVVGIVQGQEVHGDAHDAQVPKLAGKIQVQSGIEAVVWPGDHDHAQPALFIEQGQNLTAPGLKSLIEILLGLQTAPDRLFDFGLANAQVTADCDHAFS